MRGVIETHKASDLNDLLLIEVLDEPGQGNACHEYRITPTTGNASGMRISFQNGPLKETGYPNGISDEALLAVVLHRLAGFQSGEFSCHDNGMAMLHVRLAIEDLQERTRDRLARGVEGTNQQ